ncbi:ABC transporter permease [Sinanaerobacter sp. ZZT-01]|uniref:ABC transporter permease n=1 Tax=Sinanaerobacter sp. ZZT-01 TaxID=3111540 RepID=UPI002D786B9B|nr:ABC transporter permease [Sinanaerobacter sp. ZZT-01]WRR94916.1 ABC transporter permease [Sinanaerobacter sp. ZZT-01]
MNNWDLISLCGRNLLRRRTRTLLAIMGVVVGTCAIVVMLSIGFGLSVSFQEEIESYGNLHLVNVRTGGGMSSYGGTGDKKQAVLDNKTIAEIERIKGVDAASPTISEYLTLVIGKYVAQSEVVGIRPEVMQKFGYDVEEGRLLQQGDKYAIVFGNQIPSWFYNPKKTRDYTWGAEPQVDVITNKLMITGDYQYGQKKQNSPDEEKITYQEYKAKGVGILANPNDESAWSAYMSLEGLEQIQKDLKKARKENTGYQKKGYDEVMVYVGNINDVESVSETIRGMGFQTDSLNDWLKSMQDTARMIQGILGGIGAISLLVAALGITNTMIMSIYERTKEIGVMKVIGANLRDIKRMFLLEAAMIGFLGGVIGLILSYILSLLMNTVLLGVMSGILGSIGGGMGSTVSIIPWWVAAGSLIFSTTIGVVSGYHPARRAMNLSALESLKNE